MSVAPEAWQAVTAGITALGVVVSTISVALISRTKKAAEKAQEQTVPISNGFARTVILEARAASRASQNNAIRLAWVIDALTAHLADHDNGTTCPIGMHQTRTVIPNQSGPITIEPFDEASLLPENDFEEEGAHD